MVKANTEQSELKGLVETLSTRVDAIENSVQDWSSGVFDPTDSAFQQVDANPGVGSFAVSVQDAHRFGDGVRVRVHLGNLTAASISGVTLNLQYGPKRPTGGTDFLKRHEAWNGSLKKREQKVVEELRPGNWNPITIVLPEIEERNFGYLQLSISTSSIPIYSPKC